MIKYDESSANSLLNISSHFIVNIAAKLHTNYMMDLEASMKCSPVKKIEGDQRDK